MRRRWRMRRSVDNVLAEERREVVRQSLPPGPIRRPPRPPRSLRGWIVRRGAVLLTSSVIGVAVGVAVGDTSTGVAFGIATEIGLETALLQRD